MPVDLIDVKDAGGQVRQLTTQGTAINGQSLETGGAGPMGWLSSIRKAINQYYQREDARKKRAAAGPAAPGAPGADHVDRVLALPTEALLKGLALALIAKGQIDAESLLAYAAQVSPQRR